MTFELSSEEQWTEWFDIQTTATEVWLGGDLAQSISIIDEFLSKRLSKPIERQAVGFRGSLRQEAGDLQSAKADYLRALELSNESDFERYTLEQSVAVITALLDSRDDSEEWYLRTLKTAAADPTTSGASALQQLLALRGEKGFEEREQYLVSKVVHQAWNLFSLEGSPNFQDLPQTVDTLLEAQKRPFSAERPPRPKPWNGDRSSGDTGGTAQGSEGLSPRAASAQWILWLSSGVFSAAVLASYTILEEREFLVLIGILALIHITGVGRFSRLSPSLLLSQAGIVIATLCAVVLHTAHVVGKVPVDWFGAFKSLLRGGLTNPVNYIYFAAYVFIFFLVVLILVSIIRRRSTVHVEDVLTVAYVASATVIAFDYAVFRPMSQVSGEPDSLHFFFAAGILGVEYSVPLYLLTLMAALLYKSTDSTRSSQENPPHLGR